MSGKLRLLMACLCLVASSSCSARDLVYSLFGGDFRSGEGLSTEDRRARYDAEVDHWNAMGRAAPER